MKPAATTAPDPSRNPAEALTIRPAKSADGPALSRLAQLDSAPPFDAAPMLVAEVGGELRAAIPLDGGRAIADPFQRTAELSAILAERALQLEARAPRRAPRRRRLLGTLRATSPSRV